MFRAMVYSTMAGAMAAGYVGCLHKHIFGAAAYREKISYFPKEEKLFDEGTQKVINELTDYLLMHQDTHLVANTHFFWSNKTKVTHHGSFKTNCGTYIGIPVNFMYKSPSEIDATNLVPGSCPADTTNQLLDTVVMSEKAKKFAIASELNAANTYHVFSKMNFMTAAVCGYFTVYHLRNILERVSAPFLLTVLCAIVLLWVFLYQKIQYVYDFSQQTDADTETAKMDKDYLEGGLEYLSKLIKRNMILRELNGPISQSQYTTQGDEVQGFFDFKVVPLSARLKLLEDLKKAFEAGKTEEASSEDKKC